MITMNERNPEEIDRLIQENWDGVCEEVADAAKESGRSAEDVTIIGVTKYVDTDWTASLVMAGCHHLGENRPQVLWGKAESPGFPTKAKWHMIGHLQTNKVRRLLRYQPLIHSVDSERLLDFIAQESVAKNQQTRLLLEVNISGDESKTGMQPQMIEAMIRREIPPGIEIMGLMAMAGLDGDLDNAQRQFHEVRELRDRLSSESGLELKELSMGMSADYQQAIAAGATMVRIGSRLFDGLLH
jgi:pyridoxal phosphate enzyme (YggS family)